MLKQFVLTQHPDETMDVHDIGKSSLNVNNVLYSPNSFESDSSILFSNDEMFG